MNRYAHVINYVFSQPWAILEENARVIWEVLHQRELGVRLTDEEIQARIGDRKSDAASPRQEGTIAVLPVMGVIAHRMDLFTEISGGTSTDRLTGQIEQLAGDPNVSAIVLDVNSPGGGVFGLMELADTIRSARAKKPVIAVANAVMASAAYWIGSAASELVVTPSGQVGSIGVFMMHREDSKKLASEGTQVTLIKAGKYKAEGNSVEPLSDEAKTAIQGEVDHYYAAFTKDVAKGRKVSVDTVRSGFGEGRMVNASEALRLGMVDRVATLSDVLSELVSGKASAARAEQEVGAVAAGDALPTANACDPASIDALMLSGNETPLTDEDRAALEQRRLRLRLLELEGI